MSNDEDYDGSDEDRDDFEDVRHDLNLDEDTTEEALREFKDIRRHFMLEGEKMAWMACSIYSKSRCRVTQTMGRSKIEGNMVSLTRILRSCKISQAVFFNKMKNWISMANLSPEMRNKLDQLERNFNVTSVIFKKYKPMFEDIFKCIEGKTCRFAAKKNKGLRRQPLTSLDLFTFCWTLFVYIKSRYSQINDDLVNSYHLLVVCLDYCYSCALSFDNYKDIVNSEFYDALAKKLTTDPRSQNNDNRVSIIDMLCAKWHGIDIEVKQIKKHWFEPFLKALTEKDDTPIRKRANGIIDIDVVDYNFKYFKREYETYVLTIGDFDECVFLNDTASEELGTDEFSGSGGVGSDSATIDSILLMRSQPVSSRSISATNGGSRINHDQPNNIMPMTPLSSREYLASRTPVNRAVELTPISAATASISRLQSILMNQKSEPSDGLRELLAKCKNDPVEQIARMIKEMGDVFLAAFNTDSSANNENSDPSQAAAAATVGVIRRTDELQYLVSDNFPKRRLELAITFFYRVLENILNSEVRQARKYPGFDSTSALVRVLEQNTFLRSLFACSLEIVLHSYSPANRLFPWILNIYNSGDSADLRLHSFHFQKVIELIIRSEQLLSRELVKYLKMVEEAILERYAWTADSPVWALLKTAGAVPTYEETLSYSSPAPKLMAAAAAAAASAAGGIVNPPPSGMVRAVSRQLTFDQDEPPAAPAPVAPVGPPSTEQLFQLPNGTAIKTEVEGASSSIKNISEQPKQPSQNGTSAVAANRQVNSGSQQLKLFFRKVYNVALLRLRDLTKRLAVTDDLVQMMWTCLLHALRSHTELMCDHHLDQLIMCSVYVICKLNITITFADIVKEYRTQPQAKNYVYRNVLLAIRDSPGETPPAEMEDAKSGDLIKFYNEFFIKRLTESYVINFKIGGPRQNASLTLSPMPKRSTLVSPIQSPIRRVTDNVFVSPLPAHNSCPLSPGRSQSYRIQYTATTASSDLKALNSMMQNRAAAGRSGANYGYSGIGPGGQQPKRGVKRLLQDEVDGSSTCSSSSSSQGGGGGSGKMPCLSRKINDILVDRNTIQQFSAAAAAAAAAASLSANVSGAEDNCSNDSLQFNAAAANHQLAVPEIRGISPIQGVVITNGTAAPGMANAVVSGLAMASTAVLNVAAE